MDDLLDFDQGILVPSHFIKSGTFQVPGNLHTSNLFDFYNRGADEPEQPSRELRVTMRLGWSEDIISFVYQLSSVDTFSFLGALFREES